MASQALTVNWELRAQLPRLHLRKLQHVTGAIDYWLALWSDLVTAATEHAVHILLEVLPDAGLDAASVDVDADGSSVRIALPIELLEDDGSAVGFVLLDLALAALGTIAARRPRDVPTQVWINPEPPTSETEPLAASIAMLEPNEMMLLGRLDGTPSDELARFHELDDFIGEQLHQSGAGIIGDTEGGCSSATWIIEINGR